MPNFLPSGNELNGRELATITWVVIGFGYALSKPGTAIAVGRVLRALGSRWIAGPMLGMLLWTAATALVARRIDLWTPDLIKDSTEWFVLSAMLLYINVSKAYATPGYFRGAVVDNLKLTAFLIFYANLFVFSYPVELVLVLATTVLAGSSVIGEFRPDARAAKRLCDWLLGIIAVLLVGFSTQQIVTNWSTVDFAHLVRLLVLPVWLTTTLVPYLYGWSLFGTYQMSFHRIQFFAPQRALSGPTRLAMMLVLNLRVRAVAEIQSPWLERLASAGTFQQALTASRGYLDEWRNSGAGQRAGSDPGSWTTVVPAIPIPGIREILRCEGEAAKPTPAQPEG